MKLKNKTKFIVVLLFLAVIICTFFVGLVIAEKNTKKICFRDDSPCFFLEIKPKKICHFKIDILGLKKNIDLSKQYQKINQLSNKLDNFIPNFFKS